MSFLETERTDNCFLAPGKSNRRQRRHPPHRFPTTACRVSPHTARRRTPHPPTQPSTPAVQPGRIPPEPPHVASDMPNGPNRLGDPRPRRWDRCPHKPATTIHLGPQNRPPSHRSSTPHVLPPAATPHTAPARRTANAAHV